MELINTHTHTTQNLNTISGMCQFQHPGCDITLHFYKMLPLGGNWAKSQ